MDEPLLITIIKAALLVFIVITGFAYMTLWERKLIGRFQARVGPNRVGPGGYLQPLADIVKLAFKEDFAPLGANRILYRIAPLITMFAAVAAMAVIPYGETVEIFGHQVALYGASLNIDVLYLFALSGLGFYGLILGGWSSGNKYSLLGSARTAAQLVSYEVSMGLAVIGVIMMAGSLNLLDIVHAQQDTVWYIVLQPLGFLVFVIAGVAEANRAPFDLPEAESELVAGYQTEYGGMGYAVYP
ncbi:MAG TPA: NADH-quinone oxidoreductase subunit H, partial [Miltoncostaeaceae bacterium]|nr:NADH-quinone oxidoreductase subunit H [Miltoncostaeaceae bacterium]